MPQNSTVAAVADLPSLRRVTTFYGITESQPGREWRGLFDATWPAYRRWYLREGEQARPSLKLARARLSQHLPELVPIWEGLCELAGPDETAAQMLTLWDPPRYLPGCSQLVQLDDSPVLVRNYDYHPDLCERVVYSSNFTGRRVIGSSDCLWGLLDGMNDAGLAVSLTFAGEPVAGSGFGIPIVVRYLLEVGETVADVSRLLRGLPVSMAYNLTVLDRNADVATFFVTPDREVERSRSPVATNHRGLVPSQPEYARRFRSVERQESLLDLLDRHLDPETLVQRFLQPPLYNTAYGQGFGTMYTAAYRPTDGFVDYAWPGTVWRRDFDSPSETVVVSLGQ